MRYLSIILASLTLLAGISGAQTFQVGPCWADPASPFCPAGLEDIYTPTPSAGQEVDIQVLLYQGTPIQSLTDNVSKVEGSWWFDSRFFEFVDCEFGFATGTCDVSIDNAIATVNYTVLLQFTDPNGDAVCDLSFAGAGAGGFGVVFEITLRIKDPGFFPSGIMRMKSLQQELSDPAWTSGLVSCVAHPVDGAITLIKGAHLAVAEVTPEPDPDVDGDGVLNVEDNCVLTANPTQADCAPTNGYGNACDFDFDGDGSVLASDFEILSGTFNLKEGQEGYNACVDCDDDGTILGFDFHCLRDEYGESPGTGLSGHMCAGLVAPCPRIFFPTGFEEPTEEDIFE